MKFIFFATLLFLVRLPLQAQKIQWSGNNYQININTNDYPPLLSNYNLNNNVSISSNTQAVNQTSNKSPGIFCIFEYGDGRYTTSTADQYSFQQVPSHSFLTLSYRYVKPPRPGKPQTAARAFGNINFSPNAPPQQELANGQFLRIIPSAPTINADDTMVFILTYKLPEGFEKGTLLFFYNDLNMLAFKSIHDGSDFSSEGMGTNVKNVRHHHNEIYDPAIPLNYNLASLGRSYQTDWLGWKVAGNSGLERNIFITLITRDSTSINPLKSGTIDAVLIPDNKRLPVQQTTLNITASNDPHDPNYMVSQPRCTYLGKAKQTQGVRYQIHFQNEGAGSAYRLKVRAFMPKALNLNPQNLQVIIGGHFRPDIIPIVDNVAKTIEFNILKPAGYGIDSTLASAKVPAWQINPLTMGDIYFDQEIPIDQEADLVSYAKVTFYNADDTPMEDVVTQKDILKIRDCRDCGRSLKPQKPGAALKDAGQQPGRQRKQ